MQTTLIITSAHVARRTIMCVLSPLSKHWNSPQHYGSPLEVHLSGLRPQFPLTCYCEHLAVLDPFEYLHQYVGSREEVFKVRTDPSSKLDVKHLLFSILDEKNLLMKLYSCNLCCWVSLSPYLWLSKLTELYIFVLAEDLEHGSWFPGWSI